MSSTAAPWAPQSPRDTVAGGWSERRERLLKVDADTSNTSDGGDRSSHAPGVRAAKTSRQVPALRITRGPNVALPPERYSKFAPPASGSGVPVTASTITTCISRVERSTSDVASGQEMLMHSCRTLAVKVSTRALPAYTLWGCPVKRTSIAGNEMSNVQVLVKVGSRASGAPSLSIGVPVKMSCTPAMGKVSTHEGTSLMLTPRVSKVAKPPWATTDCSPKMEKHACSEGKTCETDRATSTRTRAASAVDSLVSMVRTRGVSRSSSLGRWGLGVSDSALHRHRSSSSEP
mmetsp:Transcript_3458/g.8890  ORF Transcript_3458/g.8890 Transcript_3458/m.8890 type:complete len:289 (-) Transcript_3458:124-990(-)